MQTLKPTSRCVEQLSINIRVNIDYYENVHNTVISGFLCFDIQTIRNVRKDSKHFLLVVEYITI